MRAISDLAIPGFPLKRVRHYLPVIPETQHLVVTWTRYNYNKVTEKPVSFEIALKEYNDKISSTSENLAIGILDHKYRAWAKSRGTQRTFVPRHLHRLRTA